MQFYLQVYAIGRKFKLSLTNERFHNLKSAKETLTNLFNLTENYRVVIESYRTVERAKHHIELDHILYSHSGYDSITNSRIALNSPIIGYLSSSRYYLDATSKSISKFLLPDQIEKYKSAKNLIYDSTPQYAFIEALRNYTQHRELPIHRLNYNTTLEDKSNLENSDMVTSLSIYFNKRTLMKDKKFKNSILTNMPESIDIIRCIRHHMEGIWKLHKHVTDQYEEIAESARKTIAEAITQFENESSERSLGLEAVAHDEITDSKERIPLLLDWDNARKNAQNSLGNLNNLHKRYITGKIQNNK